MTAVTFWSFSGFVVVPHPVVPHPNVELIDDEGGKEGISWPTRGNAHTPGMQSAKRLLLLFPEAPLGADGQRADRRQDCREAQS